MVTREATYQLAAETGQAMLDWITAIQNAQARLMAARLQYSLAAKKPGGGTTLTPPTKEEEEAHRLVEKTRSLVLGLLKLPGNKTCADCGAKGAA